MGQILALVRHIVLLSVYKPFVRGVIDIVSQLGQGLSGNAVLSHALGARAQAFGLCIFKAQSLRMKALNSVALIYAFLLATTVISYGLVSWAASLRICRSFNFFWSLVEVSAWGLTLDVLNFVFTPLAQDVPKEFYLITELCLCITLLLLIRAVPQTTSMLLRSQPATFGGSQLSISNAVTGMMAVQRATQTTLAKITRATTGANDSYRSPVPDYSTAKQPLMHPDMSSRVDGRDTRA